MVCRKDWSGILFFFLEKKRFSGKPATTFGWWCPILALILMDMFFSNFLGFEGNNF